VSHDPSKHISRIKAARKQIDFDHLYQGIIQGQIQALSRAITLAESDLLDDRKLSLSLIDKLLPKTGNSIRIGLTGVPGVGKSTFVESLGLWLLDRGHRVAVLAVDPSSSRTGGSILGDKTRMEELSKEKRAFIRPSPAGKDLGGVTKHTREAILLCEAAGFDIILVETVGVGQSEAEVRSMVDFFLLLALPGAGDELQGIKRGIMEMAHGIVVNKADGDNLPKARIAKAELIAATHLYPALHGKWSVPISMCSAIERSGIEDVWKMVNDYADLLKELDISESTRKNQDEEWVRKTMANTLDAWLRSSPKMSVFLEDIFDQMKSGRCSSVSALAQAEAFLEMQFLS
jgi:LAO/AO transport system kinase